MPSDMRAVLMHENARDWHAQEAERWRALSRAASTQEGTFGYGMKERRHRLIVVAFDAAADQSSIRWCVRHGERALLGEFEDHCELWSQKFPCRVVDALVVPLPHSGPTTGV